MIQTILFDLDDLMVNSAPLHMEASRRVFEPYNIDVGTIPPDVVSTYFGLRVIDIMKEIAKYFDYKGNVDDLTEERENIFIELVNKELTPMPGLFELIDLIKTTDIRRAVASSGTKRYIDVVLKKFSLTDFFEAVISGDMVDRGKPFPDVFLKAAKTLGVEPETCLVIEDAAAGVKAAKTAGMYCVAVDNTISPYKQNLTEADRVVDRLDEITLDMIKNITKGGQI